jgi:hypothetical protein
VSPAETNEAPLLRRWGTKRRALESAIEDFADGSKDVALTFNVKLEEKTLGRASLGVSPRAQPRFTVQNPSGGCDVKRTSTRYSSLCEQRQATATEQIAGGGGA